MRLCCFGYYFKEHLFNEFILMTNLYCCFQVRGHHIAKLDPLGISCVNFDDAPVTVSPNVGENYSAN